MSTTHRAEDDEDSPHDLEALRVAEDEKVAYRPGKRHHAVRESVLVDVVGVMPESTKKRRWGDTVLPGGAEGGRGGTETERFVARK